MNSLKFLIFSLLAVVLTTTSCRKDEDTKQDIKLNLNGLTDLGSDFVYEGWIIVDGKPVSTGTFSVDNSGKLSKSTFSVDKGDLSKATKFVLTIEPRPDNDPKPSNTKYLVGDFDGNSATVSTKIVGDFSNISGRYILATPTNGGMTNENSGIWWVDPTGAAPKATLQLPELPTGWRYEGWVVISGIPVSTGTFRNPSATDDSDIYSGDMPLPAPNGSDGFFPGEDFLNNAPSGLSFPTNIAGGTAVVSVEPFPDNSPKPFALKPLVGKIPSDAVDHFLYDMDKKSNFPMGTVIR